MVTVPGATPVTTPPPDDTVAIAALLLVHVPPAEVLLSAVVRSGHTDKTPVIGAGDVLTVTVVVTGVDVVLQFMASVTVSV
jgi:hypothetical protein